MSMHISFQFLQQGRSQTSEKDEASLKRRRREPLGGGGGGLKAKGQNQDEATASSCLMLATALP